MLLASRIVFRNRRWGGKPFKNRTLGEPENINANSASDQLKHTPGGTISVYYATKAGETGRYGTQFAEWSVATARLKKSSASWFEGDTPFRKPVGQTVNGCTAGVKVTAS